MKPSIGSGKWPNILNKGYFWYNSNLSVGNVIKNGIPVAIVGEPNVGKSTLLNALLNEERAIVSDIAGTTRDTIEDEISIGGIGFRFIDTAGIRDTKDVVESIGIKKTFEKMEQSQVVVVIFSAEEFLNNTNKLKVEIEKLKNRFPQKPLLIVANKIDKLDESQSAQLDNIITEVAITDNVKLSAKSGLGVELLKEKLIGFVNTGALRNNETIVTNSRHYDALLKAFEEINKVKSGMELGLSSDLMAIDIRQALFHFGEITGEITTDDLLGNIFANFCIGK